MPRFLEEKLKKRYGADSAIPYKIMNKLGFMKGSKETAKGAAAQKKHESKGVPGQKDIDKEIEKGKIDILTNGDHKSKTSDLNSDKLMGKPHHTKPVTLDQQVMSQTHKEDRAHVDTVAESGHDSREAVLRTALKYDLQHTKEHNKSAKKTRKLLNDHIRGHLAKRFIAGTDIKRD